MQEIEASALTEAAGGEGEAAAHRMFERDLAKHAEPSGGYCAALRPGQVITVLAATKHTLRAIARRWQQLNAEVIEHEKILTKLTRQISPDLVAAHGIGPDTAAEMLIVAGLRPALADQARQL